MKVKKFSVLCADGLCYAPLYTAKGSGKITKLLPMGQYTMCTTPFNISTSAPVSCTQRLHSHCIARRLSYRTTITSSETAMPNYILFMSVLSVLRGNVAPLHNPLQIK